MIMIIIIKIIIIITKIIGLIIMIMTWCIKSQQQQ